MGKILKFLKENGFIGLVQELLNRRKLWSFDSEISSEELNSSASDIISYRDITLAAGQNDEIFKKFRANREYRLILEHVSLTLGRAYLAAIPYFGADLKQLIHRLESVDRTGGPLRYYFKGAGTVSPTTLRYIHVQNELVRHFHNIQDFNVIEIGGGFGGQAATTAQMSNIKSWTIFDLPEVHALQEKFIGIAAPHLKAFFLSGLAPQTIQGDLLLSNYALSEISRPLQIEYLEKLGFIIPRGYLIWNLISEKRLGGLSLDEILALIPDSKVEPEKPLSDEGNVVIHWNRVT
jgi:hypothetical protein